MLLIIFRRFYAIKINAGIFRLQFSKFVLNSKKLLGSPDIVLSATL